MGFTSAIRSASGPRRTRSSWASRRKGEVGEVEGHDVDRVGDERGVEVAEVGALQHHDPGVLAQAAPELPVADVDGVDAGGSRREQGGGEAARGGAGVQRVRPSTGTPNAARAASSLALPRSGTAARTWTADPGGRGRRRW